MTKTTTYVQNRFITIQTVATSSFFQSDNNLKVRGPGRDILFFNEANLTDFDTFTQLMLTDSEGDFH